MTAVERKTRNINTLPGSLDEAIALTEGSALVKKALGDHVFHSFIENKKKEWDMYRTQVSEYELKRYLPIL
jgi:glutamine synthetase